MNPSPARHSPFQAILPLCLALLFMAAASPAAPVFRYLEQTGTDSFIFTWRLERERDTATLSVVQRQGSEIFLSRNTAAGDTLAWQYIHQPATDVRAEAAGRVEIHTVRGPRLAAAKVVIRPDGLLGACGGPSTGSGPKTASSSATAVPTVRPARRKR